MTVNQESVVRPRRDPLDKTAEFVANMDAEMITCRSANWLDRQAPPAKTGGSSGPSLGDAVLDTIRRLRESRFCSNPSYRLSALVGLLAYGAYGSLNGAWSNPALIGVSVYLFLSTPLYSKLSNWVETVAAELTRLGTGGRLARFLLQILDNLFLLWVLIAGQVLSRSGLDEIGGFLAAAAWITIVSQGGQYLANWMARRNIGEADRNVVWAISMSAIVSALAVSGVTWIQPAYVAMSLIFGAAIFGAGLATDAMDVLARSKARTRRY